MKPKKYIKAKQQKKTSAEEPASVYGNKSITFFNSFEEENESTYKIYAKMSPEECLALVTKMRLNAFPYLDINLYPWGNTIYFD